MFLAVDLEVYWNTIRKWRNDGMKNKNQYPKGGRVEWDDLFETKNENEANERKNESKTQLKSTVSSIQKLKENWTECNRNEEHFLLIFWNK